MKSVVKKITQFCVRKEKKQGHDILIHCVVTHPKPKTETHKHTQKKPKPETQNFSRKKQNWITKPENRTDTQTTNFQTRNNIRPYKSI